MRILLDTYVLVWLLEDSERIGEPGTPKSSSRRRRSCLFLRLLPGSRHAVTKEGCDSSGCAEWLAAALGLPGIRLESLTRHRRCQHAPSLSSYDPRIASCWQPRVISGRDAHYSRPKRCWIWSARFGECIAAVTAISVFGKRRRTLGVVDFAGIKSESIGTRSFADVRAGQLPHDLKAHPRGLPPCR